MRVLPIHAIPIFLRRALPGELGSQLRFFDVFYKGPPVVGWHVVGTEDADCVTGFFAFAENQTPKAVVGFSTFEDKRESVAGFAAVEEGACDDTTGVTGFTVTENDETQGVSGFDVLEEFPADYVAGFTVEEE